MLITGVSQMLSSQNCINLMENQGLYFFNTIYGISHRCGVRRLLLLCSEFDFFLNIWFYSII